MLDLTKVEHKYITQFASNLGRNKKVNLFPPFAFARKGEMHQEHRGRERIKTEICKSVQ